MSEAPPCRVCAKSEWVGCYHENRPEAAVCVECCATAEHDDGETGHVWTYVRAEQDRVCDHCGQLAGNTNFYDHDID